MDLKNIFEPRTNTDEARINIDKFRVWFGFVRVNPCSSVAN
jgi:hypothetical protein